MQNLTEAELYQRRDMLDRLMDARRGAMAAHSPTVFNTGQPASILEDDDHADEFGRSQRALDVLEREWRQVCGEISRRDRAQRREGD